MVGRLYQGLVLAAGAGKRLRPLSLTRSKALAPLCGRPMLAWVLDSLVATGIADLVVVVADPDDDVARWCRAWAAGRDLRLRLVVQPERLGMAHALRCAAPALVQRFIMHACDTIVAPGALAAQLQRHVDARAACSLCLEHVAGPEHIRKTAIVTPDGDRIRGIVEKPEPEDAPSDLSAMPIYLFEPEVLALLPAVRPSARGEYEIQDAISALIARDRPVHGWLVPERWQITDCADLLALNFEFLHRGETRRTAAATCHDPVWVGDDVACGAGCVLGPEAVIESGARLGAGAVVRRAVVLREAVVPDGAVVEDCVLAGEG